MCIKNLPLNFYICNLPVYSAFHSQHWNPEALVRRSLRKSLCNLAPDNAGINLNVNEDSWCAENRPSLSLQPSADCTTPAELLPVGLGSQGWEVPWEVELSGVSWIKTVLFWSWIGQMRCWSEVVWAWPWVDGFSWNILSEILHFLFLCAQNNLKKKINPWNLLIDVLVIEIRKGFSSLKWGWISLAASQPLQLLVIVPTVNLSGWKPLGVIWCQDKYPCKCCLHLCMHKQNWICAVWAPQVEK